MTHQPTPTGECRYCSVPANSDTDICGFCRVYTPTTTDIELLGAAERRIQALRGDLVAVLREFPSDAPSLDLVAALSHLRQAGKLVDEAARGIK